MSWYEITFLILLCSPLILGIIALVAWINFVIVMIFWAFVTGDIEDGRF